MTQSNEKKSFLEWLFDFICLISIVGIWPRFIEPKLLFISKRRVPIPNLPFSLDGLKVLHFADLHMNKRTSFSFLQKLSKTIHKLKPDLILFTGDFLTYSKLHQKELATTFLKSLSAPLGVYACFGNHDYEKFVSCDGQGNPYIATDNHSSFSHGFKRLFGLKSKRGKDNGPLAINEDLMKLYKEAGISILHNETVSIGFNKERINLAGLGDLMAGQFDPLMAFKNWSPYLPGIVLAHNPDSFTLLQHFPGNLYLFGHTHGGQINLPILWERVSPMKNKHLKTGIFTIKDKVVSVSRGVGATFPFRLFAPPEITLFELVREERVFQEVWQPARQEALPNASLAASSTMEKAND